MSGNSRFALLVSKFRGCLVGSLIGDCLGTLQEVEHVLTGNGSGMSPAVVQRLFTIPADKTDDGSAFPYSVRTRMLRCVGESLLQCREFDKQDLTQRLTHANAVNKTFPSFKNDLAQMASLMPSGMNDAVRQRQFSDSVALRTIPSAMFYYGNLDKALEVAQDSSSLTQISLDGGFSATLLCLTIHSALQFDPMNSLHVDLFLDNLMEELANTKIEMPLNKKAGISINSNKTLLRKLEIIREMLRTQLTVENAIQKLKIDGDSAQSESVLAAIYTFLIAHQEQGKLNTSQNPLERVLAKALSVSKSGDALAALSCSIAGAYHGIEVIPVTMRKRCQGLHETVKLADRLALPFESHPGLLAAKEISFVQRV